MTGGWTIEVSPLQSVPESIVTATIIRNMSIHLAIISSTRQQLPLSNHCQRRIAQLWTRIISTVPQALQYSHGSTLGGSLIYGVWDDQSYLA